MSNLTLGPSNWTIKDITVKSKSPYDSVRSENGLIVQTYYDDSQRYEFMVTSQLLGVAAYNSLSLVFDTLSGADSFIWEIGKYPTLVPRTGNAIGEISTKAGVTAAAGSSTLSFATHAGSLGVGDMLRIPSVTPKAYRVTEVDVANDTVKVFPTLRKSVPAGSDIEFGEDVKVIVRIDGDTNTYKIKGDISQLRNISVKLIENPF